MEIDVAQNVKARAGGVDTDLKTCSTAIMGRRMFYSMKEILVFESTRLHCSATLAVPFGGLWPRMLPAQTSPKDRPTIVGDSLSAEYGLRRGSWAALLEQRLASEDRSTGGQRRHQWRHTPRQEAGPATVTLKQHTPSVVVIELGNDALRSCRFSRGQPHGHDPGRAGCRRAGCS